MMLAKLILLYENNIQKISFLIVDATNYLISMTILQILLMKKEIWIATLAGICTNLILGYYLYSFKVFNIKKICILK